jgi:hypothetical protein
VMLRGYYASDFTNAGDVTERSLLVNSLAAQELGSDYTDPFRNERVGGGAAITRGASRWSLDVTRELHHALQINAASAHGTFVEPVSAAPLRLWRAAARVDRATTLGWFDTEVRGHAEVRVSRTDHEPLKACGTGSCVGARIVRGTVAAEIERPFGDNRLVSRTFIAAALGRDSLAAQELIFLGGTVSAPGYAFHELVGDRALSQHLELQLAVPFPSIALGRFGRSAGRAMLVPHATGVVLRQVPLAMGILRGGVPFSPPDPLRPRESGFYPSVGMGIITAFDLLRFDISRGLRDGGWVFSFDLTRAFWSVM